MRTPARLISVLLLAFVLITWYVIAIDYGDAVAAGTYRFQNGAETSTLTLNIDHTFRQSRRIGSQEEKAEGTWRRLGEGLIVFSSRFLPVTGAEPSSDGETVANMDKVLGVLMTLRLSQHHVLWYGKADSGTSLPGTYRGDKPNVSTKLILNPDHSFDQTVAQGSFEKHATGAWTQDTDGTVQFSQAFLDTSGESLRPDERATATDPKGSTLQIEVSVARQTPVPVFRKLLLSHS